MTTINPPSAAVRSLAEVPGWELVVVGDEKSPPDWELEGARYLSLEEQHDLFGELAGLIPRSHYSRKNLGYLYAASRGATQILDTDDDNLPYPSTSWDFSRDVQGRMLRADGWVNVYRAFTSELIWPRGLPLDSIGSGGEVTGSENAACPVQQFLADGDPDVDAIYRLVLGNDCVFERSPSAILERGTLSPFNSQNTLFFGESFPLLYLPSHVSFRMTDIWRSFVAQYAMWQHGGRLAFHAASAVQDRNPHDLMRDFEQEIPGYTRNREVCSVLAEATAHLSAAQRVTVAATAAALWEALIAHDVIPSEERAILAAWLDAMTGAIEEHPV